MREPQAKPAPSRDVRLRWWFLIYLAGSVPLVIEVFANLFNGFMLAAPVLFPLFLGMAFASILMLFLPASLAAIVLPLGIVASYGFYIWHLWMTLRVKTQRGFHLLLILLFIVVYFTATIAAHPLIQG